MRKKQFYVAPDLELQVSQPCSLLTSLSAVVGFDDVDFEEPSFEDIDFDTPA